MRLKDGVQIDIVYPHLMQIGQFELDALQIAAKIIVVQMAAGLIGLPEGFCVFVRLVDPVREGHGFIFHRFAETVREDLVKYLSLDALRRFKSGFVYGELPLFAVLPAHNAAVVRSTVDTAKIGV